MIAYIFGFLFSVVIFFGLLAIIMFLLMAVWAYGWQGLKWIAKRF